MSEMDLSNIDLNLLVALEILLEECHVTRAATRLDMSQPAMSRTLSRLRTAFDDPLIVRVPNGYERTVRADNLMVPLKQALDQVRSTLAKPIFDPTSTTDIFKICTVDYAEVVISPAFMALVTRKAPTAQIEIVRRSLHSIDEIMHGHGDVSLGVLPETLPKQCAVERLFEDRYVCVMRKNHPLANTQLTIEDYLAYPHSIIHTGQRPGSHIDDALQRLGHQRRTIKRSPYFTASLMSLGETDLIQTVPKRLAAPLLSAMNLVLRDLPFQVFPMAMSMMWHVRNNDNPAHVWFREQISLVARTIGRDD